MKYTLVIGAAVLSINSFAQTLAEAMVKTDNERFEAAASDFRALLAKEPNNGNIYFYYGENFFKKGEMDSANIMYTKGSEVNATAPLNYVGLGKILLTKNNVNDAKAQFFKANSLAQSKSAEVNRRIAEAWLTTDNKNADEAITQANAAIKLEPKNADNYIVLGDAQLEKNPTDGSLPIKSYQMATTLNPKSARGILREGKLYQRGRNYQLALDKYKAAELIEGTFAPAYREKAELFSLAGQPAKSIENWKKYLELNNSNYARYRYMSALFSNKQFSEAVTEYEGLKAKNFSSLYFERVAGYSYHDMGDKTDKEAYNKGLKAINSFFEMAGPKFNYLPTDYKYRGLLLAKSGKDSLGMIDLDKAISMDNKLGGEIGSELAKICMKAKKYPCVIAQLEKKMTVDTKGLDNNDLFDLGRAYYFSGTNKLKEAAELKDAKQKAAKEAEATPFFVKADTTFSMLFTKTPTWHKAAMWRGRTNAYLDPKNEKDLTKVQYEKMIALIKPEEKAMYKNDLVEAYEYLGYYYVTKKDKINADATWNLVKELDPANQKQKDYFNPPKAAQGGTKPGTKPGPKPGPKK
jgi:cytochrome c-type biogenesis protein CcmH/NrfG